MSLFKKKEKTHFERDERGQVVETTHNGIPEGKTQYEQVGRQGESVRVHVDPEYAKAKTGKVLEQEYYKKHPEKFHPTIKKVGRGLSALDKKVVDYNKRSNIMNPRRTSRSRPSMGFGFTAPRRSNANPFGSMFDTGLPKSHKKKSKKQYTIIKGKAYPIAGTGKKKTGSKSKKKGTHRRNSLYDPIDFSRW